MIDTVLFDFDGTLVDSEPNFAVSDCQAIAHFGGNLSLREHDQYIGVGAHRFLNAMKDRFGITASIDEMLTKKDALYLELARKNTPVFPVMRKLLEVLKDMDITMAVASGTSQAVLEELIVQIGLQSYFELILSAEKVENGKPAPDVFLKAAQLLGKKPENCLVLEDSISGAEAGVNAGMKTVALVSSFLRDRIHEYPDEAILIESGAEALTVEDILKELGSIPDPVLLLDLFSLHLY